MVNLTFGGSFINGEELKRFSFLGRLIGEVEGLVLFVSLMWETLEDFKKNLTPSPSEIKKSTWIWADLEEHKGTQIK